MKFTIIGAGIGGLTTAIALRKFRPDVELEIYESTPALKAAGAGLGLGANAVLAFEQIGVREKVLAVSNVLERFQILDTGGRILTQSDHLAINRNLSTVSNFSIHRADLQQALLETVGDVPLHLNKKVWDFRQNGSGTSIRFADCQEISTDYVVAADGVHSIFRQMLLPEAKIRFAGYACWRGVTEFSLPNGTSKTASETFGIGRRFGIVPLRNGRIYWFATVNTAKMKDERLGGFKKEDIAGMFKSFHAPVTDIIRSTPQEQILWNDIIDFKPIRRFIFGRVALLGDAAHATTPNLGQGACQAIESAVILGKTLTETASVEEAFKIFEQKRLPRTAKIVNRSWQMGKIAQVNNGLLASLRNAMFRLVPDSVNERQVKALLDVKF